MNYKEIKEQFEMLSNVDHKSYVKAIISVEMGINNEKTLNKMYEAYMKDDDMKLINDNFDDIKIVINNKLQKETER